MNTVMAQSFVKKYIHIVFSTKYRQPLISSTFENEIHTYLAGVCKGLECTSIIAGGYTNHVYILCLLSKNIIGVVKSDINNQHEHHRRASKKNIAIF
jgi:hypothetical protein